VLEVIAKPTEYYARLILYYDGKEVYRKERRLDKIEGLYLTDLVYSIVPSKIDVCLRFKEVKGAVEEEFRKIIEEKRPTTLMDWLTLGSIGLILLMGMKKRKVA